MNTLPLIAVLLASTAPSTTATPAPIEATKPAPSKVKGHFMTYASFGFNAYTHAVTNGAAADYTPANRAIIFQQLGAGYFFHKNLRVQLTFIFGETVTGAPANTNTFSSFNIVPQLVYSTHGFFTGGGPSFAPVSYGKAPNFDVGIYTATGYAVNLGRGFTLPIAVQLVLMLYQKTAFAVTPAVALAYRF